MIPWLSRNWPELLGLVALIGAAVISVVFAEPPTTVAPWCVTVERECGCSEESCAALADSICEKYSGPGYVAYSYCGRAEP